MEKKWKAPYKLYKELHGVYNGLYWDSGKESGNCYIRGLYWG